MLNQPPRLRPAKVASRPLVNGRSHPALTKAGRFLVFSSYPYRLNLFSSSYPVLTPATGPRASSPIKYAATPPSNVIVTPQKPATTTASTDEITEKAPLMPQYQAVGAPSCLARAFCMPSGNAIPMKNPEGNNNSAEIAIRTGVDAAVNPRVTAGLTKMKAAKTTGNNQNNRLSRYE